MGVVQGQDDGLRQQGNANRNQRQQQGPSSDGPESTTQTKTFYKVCDNACYMHGYDVVSNHYSGNCQFKMEGRIDSHTGDNLAAGAS